MVSLLSLSSSLFAPTSERTLGLSRLSSSLCRFLPSLSQDDKPPARERERKYRNGPGTHGQGWVTSIHWLGAAGGWEHFYRTRPKGWPTTSSRCTAKISNGVKVRATPGDGGPVVVVAERSLGGRGFSSFGEKRTPAVHLTRPLVPLPSNCLPWSVPVIMIG